MDPTKHILGNFYNYSDEYVKKQEIETVDFIELKKSSNYKNNFKF